MEGRCSMNKGSGGLIIAGLIVSVVGWLITTELIDFLGGVLIVAGIGVGIVGLIKAMSSGESS